VYQKFTEYKKHKRVFDFVNTRYEKLIDKYRKGLAAKNKEQRDANAVLYIAAITGQRIGSARGTRAGKYNYVESTELKKDGTPKMVKVFAGVVDTCGLSTLHYDNVQVRKGGVVVFQYFGKKGVEQKHEVTDSVLAAFMVQLLSVTKPGDYLFHENTYRNASALLEKDTSGRNKVKDFRTAIAHIMFPKFRDKWVAENGEPALKKDYKAMIDFVCQSIAKILGNNPNETRKSYCKPSDLYIPDDVPTKKTVKKSVKKVLRGQLGGVA
jgi:hypothetical protein